MNYLITGGAGFVGSFLAERLLSEGHRVEIIDDLSTGSISNLDSLKGQSGFGYVIDTIMNIPRLAELVDDADAIFHLAAAVGVRLIVESPVRTIETNIRGTEIVLELANKKKKPVLITSTSEVYGKSNKIPFAEDDDLVLGGPQKGRWSYACSKAIDEFLAIAYHKEKKLPIIVVRLFNTVGPRQTGRYGMVLPTFVRQALAGEPITVFGDGTQRRCFTDVKDVVEALSKLIATEEAYGEIFNLGSQREISMHDLAKTVRQTLGSSSAIRFIPYDQAYEEGFEDMMRRVPDIGKIQSLIGYDPKVTLLETIRRIAEHYQSTRRTAAKG